VVLLVLLLNLSITAKPISVVILYLVLLLQQVAVTETVVMQQGVMVAPVGLVVVGLVLWRTAVLEQAVKVTMAVMLIT
jgi:hypothetical protein